MNRTLTQIAGYFSIQAALIIIKLVGLIKWSWWLVFIPVWLLVVYAVVIAVVIVWSDPIE